MSHMLSDEVLACALVINDTLDRSRLSIGDSLDAALTAVLAVVYVDEEHGGTPAERFDKMIARLKELREQQWPLLDVYSPELKG